MHMFSLSLKIRQRRFYSRLAILVFHLLYLFRKYSLHIGRNSIKIIYLHCTKNLHFKYVKTDVKIYSGSHSEVQPLTESTI